MSNITKQLENIRNNKTISLNIPKTRKNLLKNVDEVLICLDKEVEKIIMNNNEEEVGKALVLVYNLILYLVKAGSVASLKELSGWIERINSLSFMGNNKECTPQMSVCRNILLQAVDNLYDILKKGLVDEAVDYSEFYFPKELLYERVIKVFNDNADYFENASTLDTEAVICILSELLTYKKELDRVIVTYDQFDEDGLGTTFYLKDEDFHKCYNKIKNLIRKYQDILDKKLITKDNPFYRRIKTETVKNLVDSKLEDAITKGENSIYNVNQVIAEINNNYKILDSEDLYSLCLSIKEKLSQLLFKPLDSAEQNLYIAERLSDLLEQMTNNLINRYLYKNQPLSSNEIYKDDSVCRSKYIEAYDKLDKVEKNEIDNSLIDFNIIEELSEQIKCLIDIIHTREGNLDSIGKNYNFSELLISLIRYRDDCFGKIRENLSLSLDTKRKKLED